MAKQDTYEVITNKIIEALERGVCPWSKPWRSIGQACNFASKKPYRGINVWTLAIAEMSGGFSSPYWLTFKQAKDAGGSIKKGEKGTPIAFYKTIEVEDRKTEEKKNIFFARHSIVFNLDQTKGIEAPRVVEEPWTPTKATDATAAARDTLATYFATQGVTREDGGSRAYYSPPRDHVQMPRLEEFVSEQHYYFTLAHEAGHSTGHKSRLNRFEPGANFGSTLYAKEELVAEMTATFIGSMTGLEIEIDHPASYIEGWLRALKNDKKLIMQAAAAAQRAVDMIAASSVTERALHHGNK